MDLATGTEAVAPGGRAAVLQLHPDYPAHWDAWDIDRHDRATAVGVTKVRSIEPLGVPGTAALRTSFPVRAMVLTDLLERPAGDTGEEVRLRPFQIVTVRIAPE